MGAEAIQFHMDGLGYKTAEIHSIFSIRRIIKRNKLKVNKRERYKRVPSKGRHTILTQSFMRNTKGVFVRPTKSEITRIFTRNREDEVVSAIS